MGLTMSVINNALSELSKKDASPSIEAAVIPPVKGRSPWVWVAAGFGISLTVGGWAISQSPTIDYTDSISNSAPTQSSMQVEEISSRVITPVTQKIIVPASLSDSQEIVLAADPAKGIIKENKATNLKPVVVEQKKAEPTSNQSSEKRKEVTPVLVAKVAQKETPQVTSLTKAAKPKQTSEVTTSTEGQSNASSAILIEQVELTPEQLADNAIGRAKKALDGNDLLTALTSYTEALRYTPRNEDVRQKLAILYFGKGDTRKAYELLQTGIRLNTDSEGLRLGLSKLLIKANQSEAALSPLVHLPPKPSKDYLSMRAALSQKAQQEQMALESYQELVNIDGDNARWWLGLGIQQERQFDLTGATHSYEQALVRVGISSQSQNFVRDRLKILKDLEGTTSAN
ncbi:MAG: tetratricopeptide repeat protein [Vibrio gallaecicus]